MKSSLEDTAFTAEASAALPGDSLLGSYRREALALLSETEIPTEEPENWRYSDISNFELNRFYPSGACQDTEGKTSKADDFRELFIDPIIVSCHNDHFLSIDKEDKLQKQDVKIINLADTCLDDDFFSSEIDRQDVNDLKSLIKKHLMAEESDSFFELLSKSFNKLPLLVYVPSTCQLQSTLVITQHISGPTAFADDHGKSLNDDFLGKSPAFFPSLMVFLGRQAKAKVLEVYTSDQSSALVVSRTSLYVSDTANLGYEQLQILDGQISHYGHGYSHIFKEGLLTSFLASLGSRMSRVETFSTLADTGATSHLYALYFAGGDQIRDMRTYQDHAAPRTTSDLIFKGAVDGNARSVYTGLITMRKGAVRAEAAQTNRNLVLSEGARADSVPNLAIDENDVKCSHASAVGPIDEQLRFYLESRGLSPDLADKLITLGFFRDLLESSPINEINGYIYNEIAKHL